MSRKVPAQSELIKLEIANRAYGKLSGLKLRITPALADKLQKATRRDGITAYSALTSRGFRGGKHLLEIVHDKIGPNATVLLSDGPSSQRGMTLIVDYEAFQGAGSRRFFELYRATEVDVDIRLPRSGNLETPL